MDTKAVNVGDILMEVSYVRVVKVNPIDTVVGYQHTGQDSLVVADIHNDLEYYVRGKELIERFISADTVTSRQRVSRTEVAERLVAAGHRPFTVEFVKTDRSKRVLRGRLLSTEHLLGRSLCEDFDAPVGDRTRLVDHRTLTRLTIQGVEYSVR